jgi:uncharacterized protein (TIGR02246 family)
MDRNALERWVSDYVRAWESNDPEAIGRLFTADATYYTAPFRQPWRGRDAIVAGWLDRKDDPGTWTFDWQILATADDRGFVQGHTHYTQPPTDFSNLWVIRLTPEGACAEFTEWWMDHSQ